MSGSERSGWKDDFVVGVSWRGGGRFEAKGKDDFVVEGADARRTLRVEGACGGAEKKESDGRRRGGKLTPGSEREYRERQC